MAQAYGARRLRVHCRLSPLDASGPEGHRPAISAAGAILHYVRETQRGSLGHLDGIRFYEQSDSLILDPTTLRNLELIEPIFGEPRHSTLLGTLDQCMTSLGARLLKDWLLRPSVNRTEIERRWEAVEELQKSTIGRDELRRVLSEVLDLERLLSKVTLESANARDLLALKNSLYQLPLIRSYIAGFRAPRLRELWEQMDELADVHNLLERSIHPAPSALLTQGDLIRPGYHAELDELRGLSQDTMQSLDGIETRDAASSTLA